MDPLPIEAGVIMPLIDTQLELDSTAATLERLWLQRHSIASVAFQLVSQPIRQVFLVGSGDSLIAAQLTARDMEMLSGLPCRAYQAYEFIHDARFLLDSCCLVIVISASGRPSPVLDALAVAAKSPARILGVTNQSTEPFTALANHCLFTGAIKKGIPTQSTTATLFLLSLLAIELSYHQGKVDIACRDGAIESLQRVTQRIRQVQAENRDYWLQQDRSIFFSKTITFLATGAAAAVAPLASNLLSCGPQRHSASFLLEEYHHSLRLLQSDRSQLLMLFMPLPADDPLMITTLSALARRGASVIAISPDHYQCLTQSSLTRSLADINREANFYHLVFLQELSLQLAKDFIHQGGSRTLIDKNDR